MTELSRIAEGFLATTTERKLAYVPADPLYANQWHLSNANGVDINVEAVWDTYNGAGVHVAIYDEGIDYLVHPDLDDNYDATAHITVNGSVNDPFQAFSLDHGTAVAGLIAAENNGVGTVGVAFGATITGVDIFAYADGSPEEAAAMQQMDNFDVVNLSWGYGGFQSSINDPAWDGFFLGFTEAVQLGRGGLGTIMVVAAGNERLYGRDTNDNNMINLPYVITVGSVGSTGEISDFSTPGANILVVAPGETPMWTTDVVGFTGYSDGTNEPNNTSADYTNSFSGTSASAPIVSGVVALMLEANPDLGWRDVQAILSITAKHTGSPIGGGISGFEEYPWQWNDAIAWNGGGMHYSNDYGFGLVDARAAVALAENWDFQHTSANITSTSATWTGNIAIPDNSPAGITINLNIPTDIVVEMAELTITATHDYLADLEVELVSPGGTSSIVLSQGGGLGGGHGISVVNTDWTFFSRAFLGESSAGTWQLRVRDLVDLDTGSISNVELVLHGVPITGDDTYFYTDEFAQYGSLPGRDTLSDSGGTDVLNAAALSGNATIDLAPGATSAIAGQALTIDATTIIENAYTGDGNDTLLGNDAANLLRGNRGDDTLHGKGGNDTLEGGDGNDILHGNTGNDTIVAGNGNDSIYAGRGADVIFANNGDDYISGSVGNDTINGDGGADEIYGNAGNDTIRGGKGNDTISGDLDNDTIYGNGGDDVIRAGKGNDFVDGGRSADTIYGNTGNDTLLGGGGNDVIDGGKDSDTINGGPGNDTVKGGGGNDIVDGGDGNDRIYGNLGADILHAGAGNDLLYGGGGADTFDYDKGDQKDRIKDFQDNTDKLDLDSWGFATVADALAHATQFGAHVLFDFTSIPGASATDTLWVENITIAALRDDIIV